MQFATLAETIFESAIGAVRKYRAARSEPLDGAFYAPQELAGISHIVAVRFDRGSESKVYVVIYASARGLSVIDASLLRGIGAGGVAQTARVRQLVTEPRDDLYAAAVEHIRSEVGSVIDVVALGDHFYRVEGTRAAELCYALFTADGAISGLAFGPTVGLMERRFAVEWFAGVPPLDTAFQVIWGGRRAVDNHHFRSREQRYALDLEPPTDCTARVVSIGAGAVTHVEDGHPDSGAAELDTPDAHFGNHIVVSSGAYEVVYAHLRRRFDLREPRTNAVRRRRFG